MNSSDQQMNSISYMETKLYEAAEAGNINPFKDRPPTSLIELLTPQKNTILHVYFENQRRGWKCTDFVGQIIDMCPQLLLQANTKGETPLHFAARYGRSNAVEVLIDRAEARPADPESRVTEAKKMLRMTNEEQDTALHVAARNIQAQVVKILTKEDREFSYSANVHGETPLYIAANMRFNWMFKRHEENRKKVIDEILSNCKSVEYCGSHGRTALHAAAMHGDHGLVNEMVIITKSSILEYGKNSELSQLTEGDCLRSDAKKMSPIKNLNCVLNEVNKLTTHFQNVDKDAFFRKYGRLMEIAKVEVLSPAVRALVHFWDPDYRCFSFGSIDLCPTVKEYGLLTEFPNDLYRVYSPLRSDKIIPELSKLLRISNLEKFQEKNGTGLKWRMLELEKKSGIEKERLIALGIFGLVLFPSQIGLVSLEAAAAYVEYENTRINPVAAILAETILTLNHCRRAGKGAMRCCTQLLYIWMVSHIETKKPVFNNFWWFTQKPLKLVEEEEWGDLDNQGWVDKLEGLPNSEFKWRAPWVTSVKVLMSCGQRRWVPLVGITGYVSYAPALVVRQLGGMQFVPRTVGIAQFSGLFKDPMAEEVLEIIKQDWKHLVLVEMEGLRDPSVSEGYEKWRDSATSAAPRVEAKSPQDVAEPIKRKRVNIEDNSAASTMPYVGVKSSPTEEEPIKRKRVSNEEDLRRQVEKLRIELSKSRKDKAMLEEMMLEQDKMRTFLDEQIQSRDEKITKLELKLVEEKIAKEGSEKELKGMSLDWMQSCSELQAMEMNFSDCQESAEYYQEKFAQVQFELMDRIRKHEDLNKKYMELESEKGGFEDVKAELAVKKNEIKVMRIKLDKEREKLKFLDEKLVAMEKHKDQIYANNTALNRTNMLLIEKMTKTDEQMDEAAAHARMVRINSRNVGGDIIRYRRSLAETDAFLGKIENRGFAFLPLGKEFREERD